MDKTNAIGKAITYAGLVKINFNPKQIILFGSYAKGTYNKDSDIDIAVVFEDYDDGMDMQLELMRLRRKVDSRIEPHPFKIKDFNLTNPFVNEIIKYGREIGNLS